MRQEILKGALLPIHRQAGLALNEPKKGLIALVNGNDRAVAYFPTKTATIAEINDKAQAYMMETDMISNIDPAVRFLYQEHPFTDKRYTMQDWLDILLKRGKYAKS
jgi:hypothetical protein